MHIMCLLVVKTHVIAFEGVPFEVIFCSAQKNGASSLATPMLQWRLKIHSYAILRIVTKGSVNVEAKKSYHTFSPQCTSLFQIFKGMAYRHKSSTDSSRSDVHRQEWFYPCMLRLSNMLLSAFLMCSNSSDIEVSRTVPGNTKLP